ncbi:MAG: hypothetical protein HKN71_06730, partial [Gemmatimonadetes bacterium]|nr:hypothetical protein [Gemmatimonadota bacterium]
MRFPLAPIALLGVTLAALPAGPLHAQDAAPALTGEALDGMAPRFIGPAVMSGRIVDLAVVGSGPVFYVASSTGGIWKTVDGGVTYADVFGDQGTHSVGDVAVHPRDTAVVW